LTTFGHSDGSVSHVAFVVSSITPATAHCAMIESRPYRHPRRPSAARAELLAQAGRQFDATCAQAAYRVTATAV